jgi:hypothetical protein
VRVATLMSQRSVLGELVYQRVHEAVDLGSLLAFEDDLTATIAEVRDPDCLDAAALLDAAWKRIEARWRELCTMSRDDALCPICTATGMGPVLDATTLRSQGE